MAARDPRTGQFVSASAERTVDAAYEDFDIQVLRTELDFDAGVGSGDTLFEPWEVTEPLGGLQRDELAELVYLETHVTTRPRAVGDERVEYRATGSIGFDGTSRVDDLLDDAVITEDVDGVNEIDRRTISLESEPDILDFWAVSVYSIADGPDGVGAAAFDRYDNAIAYRPLFGRGPVVDRHTDIFLHLWEQVNGSDNQSTLTWDTMMVWDVFARD